MKFPRWLEEIFTRPVDESIWYLHGGRHHADDEQRRVEFVTRLFTNTTRYLPGKFTQEQIHRGLWALSGTGGFLECTMMDSRIPLDSRLHCIAAMPNLFAEFFRENDYLGIIAFMWWEALVWEIEDGLANEPYRPDETPRNLEAIERTIIAALRKILQMELRICQESALHGIGHLHDALIRKDLIDDFLRTNPALDPEIRSYALECLTGDIM